MLNEPNAATQIIPEKKDLPTPPSRPAFDVTLQGIRAASLQFYDACVRNLEVNNSTENDLSISTELRLKVRIANLFLQQAIHQDDMDRRITGSRAERWTNQDSGIST